MTVSDSTSGITMPNIQHAFMNAYISRRRNFHHAHNLHWQHQRHNTVLRRKTLKRMKVGTPLTINETWKPRTMYTGCCSAAAATLGWEHSHQWRRKKIRRKTKKSSLLNVLLYDNLSTKKHISTLNNSHYLFEHKYHPQLNKQIALPYCGFEPTVHTLANPSKLCYVMTVSSVKDVVRWRSLELAPSGSGWRSPLVLTAESGGGSTVMWSSLSSSLSLLWLFSWRRARWISLGNRDIWKVRVSSLQGQKQQAVSTINLVGTLDS